MGTPDLNFFDDFFTIYFRVISFVVALGLGIYMLTYGDLLQIYTNLIPGDIENHSYIVLFHLSTYCGSTVKHVTTKML